MKNRNPKTHRATMGRVMQARRNAGHKSIGTGSPELISDLDRIAVDHDTSRVGAIRLLVELYKSSQERQ
jgi:hypothetical protein